MKLRFVWRGVSRHKFLPVRISELVLSADGIVVTSWRRYWEKLSACSMDLAGVRRRREDRGRSVISAKTNVGRKLVDDGMWSWSCTSEREGTIARSSEGESVAKPGGCHEWWKAVSSADSLTLLSLLKSTGGVALRYNACHCVIVRAQTMSHVQLCAELNASNISLLQLPY
jgi:hypothetical protein